PAPGPGIPELGRRPDGGDPGQARVTGRRERLALGLLGGLRGRRTGRLQPRQESAPALAPACSAVTTHGAQAGLATPGRGTPRRGARALVGAAAGAQGRGAQGVVRPAGSAPGQAREPATALREAVLAGPGGLRHRVCEGVRLELPAREDEPSRPPGPEWGSDD